MQYCHYGILTTILYCGDTPNTRSNGTRRCRMRPDHFRLGPFLDRCRRIRKGNLTLCDVVEEREIH